MGANFPCIRGVTPIGLPTPQSIGDGHKFGCGIQAISGNPIVYSFGSNKEQDFELAFKKIRPDAEVHTFELVADNLPDDKDRDENLHYYNIGLGYDPSDKIFKSLKEIMTMLNHTYIDVLKMDIEGFEWHWIVSQET